MINSSFRRGHSLLLGSVISVSDYEVRPRIIFISDGHPTENYDDQREDKPMNVSHVSVFVFLSAHIYGQYFMFFSHTIQ